MASAYLDAPDRCPEILRSHCHDLVEDISSLERYKGAYGERANELIQLVADSRRVKRQAEKDAYALETAARKAQSAQPQTAAAAPPQAKTTGLKLPRIKLPTFDGETSDDYRGFMEAFNETISTEPDLSEVRKWLLLRGQLSGKALQMVKELPLAAETFKAGVQILNNAYGSSRRAVLKMYQRLQMLPNAVMETENLRMTSAKMEGILLSLTNLGVKPNEDDFLRAVVISKFPHELIHTLRITDEMPLDQFRETLRDYINARDCTIQQVLTVSTKSNQQNGTGGSASTSACSGNQSSSRENGTKGGAENGSKSNKRHFNATLPSNGGTNGKLAPPNQVKDSLNINNKPKRERSRLHTCIFCAGEHWSDECDQVKTLEDRQKIVADRCQKCLRCTHTGDCVRWNGCVYCKELTHNRAICPQKFGQSGKVLLLSTNSSSESRNKSSVTRFITAMLPVGNSDKTKKAEARAVLDTAASRSLITSDFVKQLGLQGTGNCSIKLSGSGDVTLAEKAASKRLLLFPPQAEPIEIEVFVVPEIVDDVESTDIAEFKKRYPHCEKLPMPAEGNGKRVQLLLGYSHLTRIVTLEKSIKIDQTQLMATKFGWIPFGDLPEENETESEKATICVIKEVDPIKLMCDLELIGLADFEKSETEEEITTLEKFYETVEKIGKSYQIGWPYRYDPPDLEDNFGLAMGRLQSLYRQLRKSPEMLKAYDSIIRDQVEQDVAEVVNTRKKPPKGKVHYLPHRGVIRLGKSTPIRMVVDASSKAGKLARSLNDNIMKGGNWVNDLPGVLLRFRRYAEAATSDIQRAFHQILIAPDDRDVARFLWLRDINKPPTIDNIIVYRFKRMAFGIIASPFLLTATIKYHLREHPNQFAAKIEEDLYADNLVSSLKNLTEAKTFYSTVKSSFEEMGMNITQWTTENTELQNFFAEEDRIIESQQTVLGLQWDTTKKTMSVKQPNFSNSIAERFSKRVALKEMAKIFDPLGWVLPIVLTARIFLRKIWQKKFEWDTPFPDDLAEDWREIRNNLLEVNKTNLPRAYAVNGMQNEDKIQLHAFCDASAEAYGVVIYLRIERSEKSWTGIVAAKARLAPKTQLSIPRLELLAAVIATRYLKYIQTNLKLESQAETFLWGDSKCVITWVSTRKILPAFIEKAAQEIRNSNIKSFSYVPTQQNPADVVSRGANFKILQQQNWWNGPDWLSERNRWPQQQQLNPETEETEISDQLEELVREEENKIMLIKSTVELRNTSDPTSIENSPFNMDPANYRSIGNLLRVTATCYKAAARFLRGRGTIDRNTDLDYSKSMKMWLRWDQSRTYEMTNKESSNVTYLQNLKVTEDNDGLIRCKTRMKWARVTRDEIEPILLAKKTKLTKLIILSIHFNNLHSGTAHTLAVLRKKYWLPQGRREVYQVLKNHCFTCRRFEAQPFRSPEMGQLPAFRINKTETPFSNVGLDVFGPYRMRVTVDETSKIKKYWVVIFTCLVVRAIHLEILKDMSALEFLNSFRRFVGRRGVPKIVVADNAPQFKVVEGIFQCCWRRFASAEITSRYYAEHEIQWKFIPAESPWMGGAYERMIGTVKSSFERVYGNKVMSIEQFELAMIEVEAIVNCRPITYVEKEADASIVTPNDFLQVRYPAMPIDFKKAPTTQQLTSTWLAAEQALEEFWRIWSEQYLRFIRERRDKMKNPRKSEPAPPQPGEIVLMVDPDLKRSSWRTAVVERTILGEDNKIRSVQIRAGNRSRLIRPVVKLASLKLLMELPENLPELTDDRSGLVVDNQEGTVEI